jgi:peptide/nickel transport system ATP-binding protein
MMLHAPRPEASSVPVGDPRDVGGPRQPMLIAERLTRHFTLSGGRPGKRTVVRAVDDISFDVIKGETLGIVGESGCGKSTMARLLIGLIKPDSGTLVFDGEEVGSARGVSVRTMQRSVQMVFQDSYASLNPRLTLQDTIAFGPRIGGHSRAEARRRADAALQMVGLAPDGYAMRYPHELSGGQRQRVNIARALAMNPRLLILDEAVSALDKSVEAQVLNLLQELKGRLALTFIFISHDLSVVRFISDRVMVMYLGKVVEIGPVDAIYERPRHPYTEALLASRPSMNPKQRRTVPPLAGDPPSAIDPPSGCRFRTRCALAEAICATAEPRLVEQGVGHFAACLAATPGSGHSAAAARG